MTSVPLKIELYEGLFRLWRSNFWKVSLERHILALFIESFNEDNDEIATGKLLHLKTKLL